MKVWLIDWTNDFETSTDNQVYKTTEVAMAKQENLVWTKQSNGSFTAFVETPFGRTEYLLYEVDVIE